MSQRPHQLAMLDTAKYLYGLRERLPMFTITDHPSDYPDFYVARMALTLPTQELTPFAIMSADLDQLRATLAELGLVKVARDPADDPVIVECWI